MESNSINVVTQNNTIVVVEPTGNTITIIENADANSITTESTTFSPTTVTQTSVTLNLDNLPNTVTVINTEPTINEVHVTQPLSQVIEIGQVGPRGTSGTSGSSGTSGVNGSSGTSGLSGSSGLSGTSGSSGTSGTSGSSGISGAEGSSGTSGLTGSSGSSGADGASGSSGTSGESGSSGSSGVNGDSGSSGTSGESGSSGTSGTSGNSGSSGTSGDSGSSGTSGESGSSGTSGATPTINTGSFATTGSNTFIGNQTITGSIAMQGNIATGNISQTFTGTSINADFYPLFTSAISTNQYLEAHSGLKYNPSTGTLNTTKFTGSFAGTLAADLNAQSFARVINLPNPSNNGDVANKIYVDSQTIYMADNHLVYYRSADTNVNSSTNTVLDWNGEIVASTIPDFTHSSGVFTNTSTRTRRFIFQMQVAIRTQATNFTEANIWFSYNGTVNSTNRRGQINYNDPGGTNAIMLTTSWTFTLAQNETVRGYMWANQASIYGNTSPGSSFGNAYSSLIEVQELN